MKIYIQVLTTGLMQWPVLLIATHNTKKDFQSLTLKIWISNPKNLNLFKMKTLLKFINKCQEPQGFLEIYLLWMSRIILALYRFRQLHPLIMGLLMPVRTWIALLLHRCSRSCSLFELINLKIQAPDTLKVPQNTTTKNNLYYKE